ncbi:MAG TPA: histidinol-phosphate transaminase [Gemmatimonadales bacterium]|nr:histidinol-phosphate transaminase [Gemmatimonadales bacterium]
MNGLRAAPAVANATAYAPARHRAPCDLDLSGSEGPQADARILTAALARATPLIGRYPNPAALTELLADRLGVAPDRVLVTAGADEALDRICRAVLAPGRNAILPEPTFEMIDRYAALTGGEVRRVPWPDGPFPVHAMIARADDETALLVVVSPNNPTGAVATPEDVRRLHDAVPDALVLVDFAYVEFADQDWTTQALALPRVVLVRTLSKAWGLPGLRVGYAAGAPNVIAWLRAAAGPYPVSALSLAVAEGMVRDGGSTPASVVPAVRSARARLIPLLERLGARPTASQANFVCVAGNASRWIRDALAGVGIATRLLSGRDGERVRIAVPVDAEAYARLEAGLAAALAPDVVLLTPDIPVRQKWCTALAGRWSVAEVRAPSPAAIDVTLRERGARRGWMVTGTPDGVAAARAAGLVPLGVVVSTDAGGEFTTRLFDAGAARVLRSPEEIASCLI